ncbi:MAG: LysR family transcriptional regulator, partial [Pseudomonadota bacterium]
MNSKQRLAFLRALATSGNVTRAAREAGVSRSRAYTERRRNARFARLWGDAVSKALDRLEDEMMSRAIEGVDKPMFYAGKPCGVVTSYSDSLGMFLLKARRPERYGDKVSTDNADSGNYAHLDPRAELMRRLEALEA